MRQKVGELLRKGAEKASKRSVDYTSDSPVRRTAQYHSDNKPFVQRFKGNADKAGTATSMVKRRGAEYKKKTLPDREAAAADRDRDIDAPMSGGGTSPTPKRTPGQLRRIIKSKGTPKSSDSAAGKATDAVSK
jgi:hypothetical protein